MPNPANFFERYVLQQYRNTTTSYDEYDPPFSVDRYWFQLQLSDLQYASLVALLPIDQRGGNVPLLGALLYYNVNSDPSTSPSAYAVVWWYSTEFKQASFSTGSFLLSNWPSDFNPNAYVNSSRPITVPDDVVFATSPRLYESSESIPSCPSILKLRTDRLSDGTFFQDVFHPVSCAEKENVLQSGIFPPYRYNTQSDKGVVVSTSKSLTPWIALNKAYITSLPYPLPTTTNSSVSSTDRSSSRRMV